MTGTSVPLLQTHPLNIYLLLLYLLLSTVIKSLTLVCLNLQMVPMSIPLTPVLLQIRRTTTTSTTTSTTTNTNYVDELDEKHTNDAPTDTYVDITENSIYAFDRNIHSKVGASDIPPLERPKEATVSNHDTTTQPSPPSSAQKSTPTSTNPTVGDAINVEPLWEFETVIGRRPTKFGKKKSGRWKHGGNTYDYEVKWSNGETSFEPESLLKQHAADAIEEFELRNQQSTSSNFQADCDNALRDNDDSETTSSIFVNLCNFVHINFFCYISQLLPVCNTSWKNIKVPLNRTQMLRSPEKEKWLAAERAELAEIYKKNTWKKVKRPKKKPISCRWVYKIKPPTTLQPEPIFKCRLCAHGYKQQFGIDYSSTFAQVATFKAFRIMMWLSVFFNFRATQMDVKNAFLAGKLDAEIYMEPPPGYEDEVGYVLLEKSLYGLKQAPRIWYNTLVTKLNSLGFKELVSDSCVFRHHTEKCYILVFVDDIIIYTKNEEFRSKVEQDLQKTFDLKLLGTLRHFIGLQIDTDDEGTVHIHQYNYIQKLKDTFSKYFTSISNRVNTPCDSEVKFSKNQQPDDDNTKKRMRSLPYRQLIGSLLYLLGTRPELYFIIIVLSRFVNNPGYIHWLAALRVLFYVCNTPLFGILIRKGQFFRLSVYVDSDHAADVDDRKSISGYIIYLGSTPIVWRSKKQKGKAAESSCEAEYISMSACINELVWIIAILSELSLRVPTPVPIYCDNKAANDLAYNPVHHDRTKHIDIRYHRIREFILDGTVEIVHIRTEDNPADIFTKSVTPSIFKKLIRPIYGKFPT